MELVDRNQIKTIFSQKFGKDNECEVFGEMEIFRIDVRYVSGCIEKDLVTNENIEELLARLERSSIFADECIVLWIKLYSEEFSEYFDYMQSVETLRSACLVYLNNFKSDK